MRKFKPLAPGVYFGLDEVHYHTDPAVGSTDIRRLRRSAPDYWWHSHMNPSRPPVDEVKPTPSRLLGKAMHKLVLEGKAAFDRLYMRRPDDVDGASSSDKSAVTKAANAAAEKIGKSSLKGDDYDRTLIAGMMISKNPNLAGAFDGGASEVSVFWDHPRIDGLRLKVRFDKLKPRGIGDLKSIANERGREFGMACRNAISDYRYDIQGRHYLEGRAQIPALFKAGAVFDEEGLVVTDGPEFELIDACAAEKAFAFQWVFFQSQDSPIAMGYVLSPANPICKVAALEIDNALAIWEQFMEQFGPKQMWLLTNPVEELSVDEMPGWFGRG